MADKRRDSGEYYPGGKIIPRQPVRPGGGSDVDAVHYYAETKTDAQKEQARRNIGAMSADTPIPSPAVLDDAVTQSSANGVKSSGIWSFVKAQVAEKLDADDPVLTPTAPSVDADETALAGAKATGTALAGKATKQDLAGYLPLTGGTLSGAVQAPEGTFERIAFLTGGESPTLSSDEDGHLQDDYFGKIAHRSDLISKADRPALPVTAGNLAALDAVGNLADSGIAKDDVATKDDLNEKADKSDLSGLETYVVTDAIDGGVSVKINGETVTVFADLLAKCQTGRAVLYGQATTAETGYAFYTAASVTDSVIQFQVSGMLYDKSNIRYGMYVRRIKIVPRANGGLLVDDSGLEGPFASKDYVGSDEFATDLLGKPVAKEAIDARLPYPINTAGTILDRNVNVVTSGAFVIPEGFNDLLIRYTGTPTSLTFSGADASITDWGDGLPTESGDYLITVSRIAAAECYIRIIKLESRA